MKLLQIAKLYKIGVNVYEDCRNYEELVKGNTRDQGAFNPILFF